jgi:heme O synthase-like polyprenyltransferase
MKKRISRIIIMVAIISLLRFVNINTPELFYYVLTVVIGVPLLSWAILNLID